MRKDIKRLIKLAKIRLANPSKEEALNTFYNAGILDEDGNFTNNFPILQELTTWNKGDKLLCTNTIKNIFGNDLFVKNKTYEILAVIDDNYILDHILYANEYQEYSFNFLKGNFRKIM